MLHTQVSELIIKPALNKINSYSMEAELLLLCTIAQESKGGFYIAQIKGPALGIYQMESASHDWVWKNYLRDNTPMVTNIYNGCGYSRAPLADRMVTDSLYATMVAYALYLAKKAPIMSCQDRQSVWPVYKKFWNTDLGSATEEEFFESCTEFLGK